MSHHKEGFLWKHMEELAGLTIKSEKQSIGNPWVFVTKKDQKGKGVPIPCCPETNPMIAAFTRRTWGFHMI